MQARLREEGFRRFQVNSRRYGEERAAAGVPKDLASWLQGSGKIIPRGRLNSGGLTSGELASSGLAGVPDGRPSVLSAAERRHFDSEAFRNALLANPSARRAGTTAGAYDVVHRGDARRRKEAAQAGEREKLGLDATNAILTGIDDTLKKGLLE